MKIVYLLSHVYEYYDGEEREERKELGIYESESLANKAIERYYKLPGFSRYPKDCFYIEKYILNEDKWWNEGFIGWEEASCLDNE